MRRARPMPTASSSAGWRAITARTTPSATPKQPESIDRQNSFVIAKSVATEAKLAKGQPIQGGAVRLWIAARPSVARNDELRGIRMPLALLPTSLVGSYAQPEWLIDRAKLAGRFPPRTRQKELWRIPEEFLEEAWDDATIYAIHEQERAGLDIITDGEMRRESYSTRFATALDGVDMDNHGTALDRSGEPVPVPRVVGQISRRHAVQVRDVEFMKLHTDHAIKITVPGPFTMSQQAQDDYYGDPEALAVAYAGAVNEEIKDLFAAGADVVQLDEPYMQARPDKARAFGLKALERALEGVECTTALHICFGYAHLIHERPEGYSFLPDLRSRD